MNTNKILTIGIDLGSSNVKIVLMEYSKNPKIIDKKVEKIRKRDPSELADELTKQILIQNNLTQEDIAYIASTGEGELVKNKTGHFYSMTTHAKGAIFFCPNAKTVIDLGALYVRAMKVDSQGKVLDYQMTGQCASGSGQFIENISKYLGLAIEEVGDISLQADNPEVPSGICAVLAETDVINSVSRGVSIANIIKGIHLSIANRIVKLISKLNSGSPIILVGGMALNKGMVQAIKELLAEKNKEQFEVIAPKDAIYSGAVGAALWGGFRYNILKKKNVEFVK